MDGPAVPLIWVGVVYDISAWDSFPLACLLAPGRESKGGRLGDANMVGVAGAAETAGERTGCLEVSSETRFAWYLMILLRGEMGSSSCLDGFLRIPV